jgi:hypothetical protein
LAYLIVDQSERRRRGSLVIVRLLSGSDGEVGVNRSPKGVDVCVTHRYGGVAICFGRYSFRRVLRGLVGTTTRN